MGASNREPQEYSRNIREYEEPGRDIPTMFLGLCGVPSKVPLNNGEPAEKEDET